MSAKVDYISQMVAETFNESQGDLLEFTPPKGAEDHQLEMDFSPTGVSYDEARKCLVMDLEGERFEIPTNFGSFKDVDFASETAHFYISNHRDPDSLLGVLSTCLNRPVEVIEIYAGDGGLKLDIRLRQTLQQAA